MENQTLIKFRRSSKKGLFKRFLRGCINPHLVRITRPSDYDIRNSILILGGPRSGTTWLAEILNTVENSGLIFEPLYLPKVKAARSANVGWHTFMSSEEKWPEGYAFIEKVLRGEILNFWTTSFMPLSRAVHPQIWVIKMVRANMMLGWMLHNFPFLKPVVILRHPCATILSMRQQGWKPPASPPHLKKVESTYPHIREIIKQLHHPLEYWTALWCISNYVALQASDKQGYLVMSYEGLVENGTEELDRLFTFLQIDKPGNAVHQLRTKSQMTKKDSTLHSSASHLAQWRNKLSQDEISLILDTVQKFGLDFYNYEVEPDYDVLYN